MNKSPKEMYAVPEWMRQYLPLFQNTGGNDVEELLHDEDTNMFANSIRYMLIVSARSQFSLLMGMHSQGIALASMDAKPAKCGHVDMDCDDGKAVCLSCGKVWEV